MHSLFPLIGVRAPSLLHPPPTKKSDSDKCFMEVLIKQTKQKQKKEKRTNTIVLGSEKIA